MVNNVGKVTQKLNTELGAETPFTTSDSIILITGEIGTGLLLFDSDGTLGVISEFTSEKDFVVTTYALSINIETILSLSY